MFDFDVVTGPMPDRKTPQGEAEPAKAGTTDERKGKDGADRAEAARSGEGWETGR